MTSSIPKELIDQLGNRVVVAGQSNSGKSFLLKALGAELQCKYSLKNWTFLSEFYSEGKGSSCDILNTGSPEETLYMCDMPYPRIPTARHVVELYTSQLFKTVTYPQEDAEGSWRLPRSAILPEDAMVVTIVDVERHESSLRLEVNVYRDLDINAEPLGRHTVILDLQQITQYPFI
jgi:hypothetical protein